MSSQPSNRLTDSSDSTNAPSGPDGSGRRGLLRFVGRLCCFWLPVVAVLVACELILANSGEVWPIERVMAEQRANPNTVYMRLYLDQAFYRYKFRNVMERRPEILALGSSRVMRFRTEMFGQDAPRFYNAGGMIQNLEDLHSFIGQLPKDWSPRTVLLGIDMWWLNENRPSREGFSKGIHVRDSKNWRSRLRASRGLVNQLLSSGELMRLVLGNRPKDRIGLYAILKDYGFRADGSIHYSPHLEEARRRDGWRYVDAERPPIPERIRKGTLLFQFTDGVSDVLMARLHEALTRLRHRGVFVVGFAPPLSAEAAALMEADPRQAGLWREYRQRVPAVFQELGMPYIDASTTAALGLDDRYLTDGIHGAETFHLHVLRRALKDQRVARALPSASGAVERALKSPATTFWQANFRGEARAACAAERAQSGRADTY